MKRHQKVLAERFTGSIEEGQEIREKMSKLRSVFDELETLMSKQESSKENIIARTKTASAYLDVRRAVLEPVLAKFPELDEGGGIF